MLFEGIQLYYNRSQSKNHSEKVSGKIFNKFNYLFSYFPGRPGRVVKTPFRKSLMRVGERARSSYGSVPRYDIGDKRDVNLIVQKILERNETIRQASW